ncbi:MAG: hypothetical protein NT127_08555 [Sphingobacteriales bacterium]|nr:hypothetical protein [Sphingobacteriales bacterium]
MQKIFFTIGLAILFSAKAICQVETEINNNLDEAVLETNVNAGDETDIDNNSLNLKNHEREIQLLNINEVTKEDLQIFGAFKSIQIESFLSYRKTFGEFISKYELQSIPNWDIALIKKMHQFVCIKNKNEFLNSLPIAIKEGSQILLLRTRAVLEKSIGYYYDTSTKSKKYAGIPASISMKYQFKFKQDFKLGILMENDAGERFTLNGNTKGFDFISSHLYKKSNGFLQLLCLGDYTVNIAQGLIQWQTMGVKKSTEVNNIKHESEIIKPYQSFNEINFHRGICIGVKKFQTNAVLFYSNRNLDANTSIDSSNNIMVSSLNYLGLHRTENEISNKKNLNQQAFGVSINSKFKNISISVNALHYKLKFPIQKQNLPYNLFAFKGNSLSSYSIGYSFTKLNTHFFGETAFSYKGFATTNGLLSAISGKADLSILYRNLSKSFQSINANAFTENSSVNNEKGVYFGISIKPQSQWQINMSADFFSMPWLQYQTNAPSSGVSFLIRITNTPNKKLSAVFSFKHQISQTSSSEINNYIIKPLSEIERNSLRCHLNKVISPSITWRSRMEFQIIKSMGLSKSEGFLFFTEMLYKPLMKRISSNVRVAYFECTNYDSRIYAFENDLSNSYALPAFYDDGFRYFLNVQYVISKKIHCRLKFSQNIYPNKKDIGTGYDLIKGCKKTQIGFETIFSW